MGVLIKKGCWCMLSGEMKEFWTRDYTRNNGFKMGKICRPNVCLLDYTLFVKDTYKHYLQEMKLYGPLA